MFIFNYALQPSKLIVRSELDAPTFAHQASPRVTTREHPAAEGGTVGEKCPVILPECRRQRCTYGSFTWDRRLYFPSEGRRAEDFFALKIRRLRLGANPRTWGTKGQHATSRPPKPLSALLSPHSNGKTRGCYCSC